MSQYAWWKTEPTTKAGTTTDLHLSTGAIDVEKGNVYKAPAGTPISIPVQGKLVWKDTQHAVVQVGKNFLNFLHINTDVPVGAVVRPGTPFGQSSGLVGSAIDPVSHITYVESGNIIEVGLYDSLLRAINRENYVGGRDMPYDFTGIANSDQLSRFFSSWKTGDGPEWTTVAPGGTNMMLAGLLGASSSKPNWTIWVVIVAAALLLALLLRK